MKKIRQTSLPADVTDPVTDELGYSTGAQTQLAPLPDLSAPKAAPARKVEHGPHRFISQTRDTNSIPRSIIGSSLKRKYLLIQNVGVVTVYLGFGVTPTVNGDNAIELPAGVAISFENGICPNTEIEAISSTGSTLAILEGVSW